MSSSSLSPRSKMAQLAHSVAAAASASASTSASAKKQRAPPKRKNAVKKLSSSVAKESPFSRKSAVRVRRLSQTPKYQKALAKFQSISKPGNRLSRTTSTRNVSKSNVRRPSLPDLFQKNKSPTGAPKGNLANAAIEKLITSVPESKRQALFNAINKIRLDRKRQFKLPRQNLADPRAVAELEKAQKEAREARAMRVAATEAKRLNENEAKLKKLADDLKELKKKHHEKTSESLDLESTFRPFILMLPQLVPIDKKESEMTRPEKAYKKKYDELNKEMQAMVKQLDESKKAITAKESILDSQKKTQLTPSEARRKLEQLEQEKAAQASAEVEKSQAAKAEREQAQEAADRRQKYFDRHPSDKRLGEGTSTSFGKKRSKKEGKKTKITRGASKKKVGGYSNSNKLSNYGSYP